MLHQWLPAWLGRKAQSRSQAKELYGAVVTAAREPALYARFGVPDTPEGRYGMVVLHLALLLERLRGEGPRLEELARLVAEAFVTDMDDCLRELGVGDLSVPKKVKRLAAGLYERSAAYRAALTVPDDGALKAGLEAAIPGLRDSAGLSGHVGCIARHLSRLEAEALGSGRVSFPPVAGPA